MLCLRGKLQHSKIIKLAHMVDQLAAPGSSVQLFSLPVGLPLAQKIRTKMGKKRVEYTVFTIQKSTFTGIEPGTAPVDYKKA